MTQRAFTVADANAAGHFLHAWREDNGTTTADCETADGERCWSFAPTGSLMAMEENFVRHAAEGAGVCWACSQPEKDRPNRERCHRCWLMYHSEVHHLRPRDCPPFPGEDQT